MRGAGKSACRSSTQELHQSFSTPLLESAPESGLVGWFRSIELLGGVEEVRSNVNLQNSLRSYDTTTLLHLETSSWWGTRRVTCCLRFLRWGRKRAREKEPTSRCIGRGRAKFLRPLQLWRLRNCKNIAEIQSKERIGLCRKHSRRTNWHRRERNLWWERPTWGQ